jgi:hypothetical protein
MERKHLVTTDELRKAQRYDSLLFTHQRSLQKIVRLQDEIGNVTAANEYYRKRVASLERLLRAKL